MATSAGLPQFLLWWWKHKLLSILLCLSCDWKTIHLVEFSQINAQQGISRWAVCIDLTTSVSAQKLVDQLDLGGVSLTFRELSKILSKFVHCRNQTSYENSSYNFVRVPKAMIWAHVQCFSLTFSPNMWFLALYIFATSFGRARETLVKQPFGTLSCSQILATQNWDAMTSSANGAPR